jgi:hypothetical protein
MQVTFAQFGQLAPLTVALPPYMKGLTELGENALSMMIYH